jgi:hypothetical protein
MVYPMVYPWNRNEGAFASPSSGLPPASKGPRRPSAKRDYVAQRLTDAAQAGVRPVGGPILRRIDRAMTALVNKGHGHARSIYLTDADFIAFREKLGAGCSEWRDCPVRSGAVSKVYSARGAVTIRKR